MQRGMNAVGAAALAIGALLCGGAAEAANGEGTRDDPRSGWYQLRLTVTGFKLSDGPGREPTGEDLTAGPDSDFHILGNSEDGKRYLIYFTDVEKVKKAPGDIRYVGEDTLYEIDKKQLTDIFYRRWRISHGLLIIPFKLRMEDKSLSGQSTIGYYIGWEEQHLQAAWNLVLAGGLTLIPVTDAAGETEERTGATLAAGMILKTIDQFQLGAFVGVDHLGGNVGKEWEYEDDPWISLSIGFDFSN